MKSLIVLLIGVFFAAGSLFAQPKQFKTKNKKPSGTTPTSFSAPLKAGNSNMKSTHITKSKSLKNLNKLDLKSAPSIQMKELVTPRFFERDVSNLKSATLADPEERFYNFFDKSKALTKIEDAKSAFTIKSMHEDKLGITHYRSVQLHKGIEIYGSEATLHFDDQKERFTGSLAKISKDINDKPVLSELQAVSVTLADLKDRTVLESLSTQAKKILNYEKPFSKLVYFKGDKKNYRLAYEIEVRPNIIEVWKYFVDAENGEILRMFNATNTNGSATAQAYDLNGDLRTINTYLEGGSYFLYDLSQAMFNAENEEGMIITLDAQNTSSENLDYANISSFNNTWNNPTAVSAHANSIAAYRYYYETFDRNSINGQGGSIISLINVANEDGSSMDNAYWNGVAAFYGNGGSRNSALAGALDIIAHELGHGVISNSANLEYYAQSGAINEAYADIFGAMVDREDWLIGEDVTKNGLPMRNIQDPHNGGTTVFDSWSPKHMSEIVTGSVLDNFVNRDNEGVHINCTIGSHAYYLYATAVSKDKAEQVFYRALVNYLTKTSQFVDLRIAVIQAAIDLYGDHSTEVAEAAKAFDKVGIYGEDPVDDDLDYEVNNGMDYILSYDTDFWTSSTLFRCTGDGEDFIAYTTTDMKGKVSVVDNGEFAVFTGTDDYLKYIYLDENDMEEGNLSSDAFWDNVAVSKDGNRVAAISTEIDTSIYVFDLVEGGARKFRLYNPTTSHDIENAGGVLYADAIEFDITGEYLIYDAYNELTSTSSEDISYWDIGFIHVWDNQSQDFGTGYIEKLFSNLPEGVSVGNPVFSKNSPDIIAFDYFDEEGAAIVGVNINTGDLDVIFVQDILGYPTFSRLDDKILFSALDLSDNEVVAVVPLADNKISASGEDAYILIDDAKWPVYFATGERALGLPPVANYTADYREGSAPFVVRFIDLSENDPLSYKWTFEGGSPSSSTEKNPTVIYYNNGRYRVDLTVTNDFGNNVLSKSEYIVVDESNGANEFSHKLLHVFPNPAVDVLYIQAPELIRKYELTNLNGQLVDEKHVDASSFELSTSGLASGFYLLKLYQEKDMLVRKIQLK